MIDVNTWLHKFEWAIEPRIGQLLFQKLAMQKLTPEMIVQFEALSISNAKSDKDDKPYTMYGDVAVIRMAGTLVKRMSMSSALFGEIGTVNIGNAIHIANQDRDVRSIVMQIDSPGGTVDGTAELAEIVADSAKPIVAWMDGTTASAAYWVASQASAVIAKPTSLIGSIGTLLVHQDHSVRLEKEGIKVTPLVADSSPDKSMGNNYEPLSDVSKAYYIDILNTLNAQFQAGVRAGRGDKLEDETEAFSGRVFVAEKSPTGLFDRIGSFEDAIKEAKQLGQDYRHTGGWLTPNQSIKMSDQNSEVIAFVRHAFDASGFKSTAIEMAFDGKSAADIVAAFQKEETTAREAAEAKVSAFEKGLSAIGIAIEGDTTKDSVKAAIGAKIKPIEKDRDEWKAKAEAGGHDAGSGKSLIEEYNQITDPSAKTDFYRANKDALIAEARKQGGN